MFFSVLIAVYNAEKYLDRCIDSIIQQTEKDYELILVDDGSKDKSLEICFKWKEKYPDLIRVVATENQGSLMARRRCFEESKGKYIYILDADDYIMSNVFLSDAKDIINNNSCDMLFFNATNYEDKRPLYNYQFENNAIFEGKTIRKIYDLVVNTRTFNPLWNKIFKREMIDWDTDYKQYKQVSNGTDAFQMIPILFNCKKIIYWDKVNYYYQIENNNNSIIHKFNPNYYMSVRSIYDRLNEYCNQNEYCKKYYEEKLKVRWLNSISSSVYKVRLSSLSEKEKNLKYVSRIGEDSLFREYYSKSRIKQLSLSRRIILRLLYSKKYNLLIRLIFLKYKFLG